MGRRARFICPGSTEAAFLEATLPAPDLELVLTTHESVAVAAADGHARATGRPAVAYVHTHLGLENGLAHLACAHLERSPVVVLNGLKSTRLQGRAGFTTSHDVRALARQHVKWDWQSLRADAVVEDLTRALRTACAAPAGPTYLGLPQDLLEADAGAPSSERVAAGPEPGHRARPDPERVAAAAAALASARRPAIVSGADLETDAAVTQLGRIAERLAAPVFAEDRRSIAAAPFPVDHPCYAGTLGLVPEAVADADLVFLAGARTPIVFDTSMPASLPAGIPLVHLNESTEEILKGPPGALPLIGDAELALRDLAAHLERERPADGNRGRLDRPPGGLLDRARTAFQGSLEAERAEADRDADAVPMRVPSLLHRLGETLASGDALVEDSVTSRSAVLIHLLSRPGPAFYTTSGGSLGWGMGAAVGIGLADPGRQVTAVVGDGVFLFGVQALSTAVRHRVPVTYVVVNNESYAAVKAAVRRLGGEAAERETYPASDLAGAGLATIADGFGALGRRVERLDELDPALEAARAHDGPAVVEVMTDPDDLGLA